MQARITTYSTDAEALDLFDEMVGNRTPAQAVALIRAIQSGDAVAAMALLTVMYTNAVIGDADQEDAERDDLNERADQLRSQRVDAQSLAHCSQVSA